MDCYKDFARVYDELINNDIDYKAFGSFILELCEKHSINKTNYMDLACGTGNLTQVIFKSFKYSFGVDMSSDMLTEAERKMRNCLGKPKFLCQDICELNVNNKFDLITCCLDSINYILEEDSLRDLFIKVKEHLNKEGLFIFDINSFYKLENILGNNTYTFDNEEVFYVWENKFEDEIVDMYLNFFIKEGEKYHRVEEQHSERAYSVGVILQILRETGLNCIGVKDCYGDKEISETTERITFIVKGE